MTRIFTSLLSLLLLIAMGVPAWAAPDAPANLTSTPMSGLRYQIAWTSSPNTTSSTITLSKSGVVYRIRTSGDVITPVFPSGGNWTVSIINRVAGENSPPATMVVPVTQNAPSVTPSGVIVQNGDARVDLRWTGSTTNDSMKITWNDPITSAQSQLLIHGTYVSIRGLQNTSNYVFTMAWENGAGTGPSIQVAGNPVNVRLTTPISPDATAASGNSTNLSWGALPGATYYATYSGPSSDLAVLKATRIPRVTATPAILLTNLSPGWYAFVIPGNSNGLGVANPVGTPLPLITAPQDAPNLILSVDHQTIITSWTGVGGATSYQLYFMPTPFILGSAQLITPVTSPYTITGLTNGTEYGFQVRGSNFVGDGPLSTVATATPVAGWLGFQGISLLIGSGNTLAEQNAYPNTYLAKGIALVDGRVMFASSNDPARSRFYTTNTETWSNAPLSPIDRYQMQHLFHLNNGRILAFTQNVDLEAPIVYTPSTDTWSSTNTLLVNNNWQYPTSESTAVRMSDDNILYINGLIPAAHPAAAIFGPDIQTAYIFNTTTYTWTGPFNMNGQVRQGSNAITLANGKILVSGGRYVGEGGCWNPNCEMSLMSAELFDPATNTFTPTGEMTYPRYDHVSALLPDGRVLVFGGLSANGTPEGINENHAEIYDPVTGTWSLTGTLPNADWQQTISASMRQQPNVPVNQDGSVVVLFGKGPKSPVLGDTTPLNEAFYVWDPTNGQWTEAPAGPTHYPVLCDWDPALNSGNGGCSPTTSHYYGTDLEYLPNGQIMISGPDGGPRLYQ